MPRRKSGNKSTRGSSNFRFVWVDWSESKLTKLREWINGNSDTLESSLQQLVDSGWKLSISENQQSGRYLASISDKWDRSGCSGVSYGIEHGSIVSAILGAVYYATECLDGGCAEQDTEHSDDLW